VRDEGFKFCPGDTLVHACPAADCSLRFFVVRRMLVPGASPADPAMARWYSVRVFTSSEMLPALVELEECELAPLPPEGEAPF
jgi:hypothetical protein